MPSHKQAPVSGDFAALLRVMYEERHPRLPDILKLARLNGWNLQALAQPLGITREGVRLIVLKSTDLTDLPDLPLPPQPSAPSPRPPRKVLLIRPEVAGRLREMHAVSRRVNGGMDPDDPARRVSEEFSALLAQLVAQGVSVYRIAKVLGCEASGINARLARHGYRKPAPSQSQWQYRNRKVSAGGTKDACRYGHPLSGDNLRIVGRRKLRVCKACDARRHREWYARRQARAALAS